MVKKGNGGRKNRIRERHNTIKEGMKGGRGSGRSWALKTDEKEGKRK